MHKITYDQFKPKAIESSVIQGDKFRITILTPQMVRLEYSEKGIFEDGQSKMVLNRNFEPVDFMVYDEENSLKIITQGLTIKYDKKDFSPYGLSVELNGKVNHPYRGIWHFGDTTVNLGGTARTLDFIDGATKLNSGLMSKYGISMIDDSNTPILTSDGWFQKRDSNDIDVYIFGYKQDYHKCLNDYYKLTGPQPKLPKYALGNWWSRYYKYSEESYLNLMKEFNNQNIPFSVAVIDMDWHLTEVPEKYGTQWTGYSWNYDLFPDPQRFLTKLQDLGLATTLNIHPHSGVRPFEEQYTDMAKDLGVDYENDEFIDFNPYSEEFLEASFKHIFNPNEEKGVDFWWVDWQQGPHQLDESIDPLWILNHYHFSDNQKNNNLGLTFSRYSGPGSHRYPVGFSGDTVISWDSLDFQPYFTATATNIGYGWWSHDIGGHRHGYRDDELMTRWLQFGVFSPINRLHSADSDFLVKEPWNYREPYATIMSRYYRLRHKILPYVYSANVISNQENAALIYPMYYNHPLNDESYSVDNQYYFGTELVVCPMTSPVNSNSLRSEFSAWLPEGDWFDIQTGMKYQGDRSIDLYRSIEQMPLLIKAGGIIPTNVLSQLSNINSIENPKGLEIFIGTQADGKYTLFEDEIGNERIKETSATTMTYSHKENTFIIHAAEGNADAIPQKRNWILNFYGEKISSVKVEIGNHELTDYEIVFDENKNISTITIPETDTNQNIKCKILESEEINWLDIKKSMIFDYLIQAQMDNQDKKTIVRNLEKNSLNQRFITNLNSMKLDSEITGPILEITLA